MYAYSTPSYHKGITLVRSPSGWACIGMATVPAQLFQLIVDRYQHDHRPPIKSVGKLQRGRGLKRL